MSLLDNLRTAEYRISDAQTYVKNGMLGDAIYEVEQALELLERAQEIIEYLLEKKGGEDVD